MHVEYPSVKTTTHSEDLISDKCIDAIAVGTPVAAHFELGMAALKAGTLCGSKNQ
jgi:predicted dehydrogenase